jgi:DNA-binding transcriptional MerR regulator
MPATFAIGDLAELAGVSRRTVRYYVQEGLLPAPLGLGRGNHYGQEHLDRLLRIKALQEAGQSLDGIRRALYPAPAARRAASAPAPLVAADRTLWRRLTLAPGIELHIEGGRRLPSAGKLDELAAWCRANIPSISEDHDG